MSEALSMGGYGPYVWSCIGLTLIVLAVCAISARRRQHRIFNDIRTQLKAMEQSR